MKNQPHISKIRAPSTPALKASKAKLLRSAYERLARAKKLGSHIEAVAIIETLMSDRLEVLESFMLGKATQVDTLGRLLARVRKFEVIPEDLLDELELWSKSRNLAIHRLVKITDPNEIDWNRRIIYIRNCARDGELLLTRLKKIVEKNSKERVK